MQNTLPQEELQQNRKRTAGVHTSTDTTAITLADHAPLHHRVFGFPALLVQRLVSMGCSSEEIKEMARYVSSLANHFNKRIALVGAKDLPYGLMRMSIAWSEEIGITSGVFRTLTEARTWLLIWTSSPGSSIFPWKIIRCNNRWSVSGLTLCR